MQKKRRFLSVWKPPVITEAEAGTGAGLKSLERRMATSLLAMMAHLETMPYILAHSQRVAQVSIAVAECVGVNEMELSCLRKAAEMHEIGMIGIPQTLLTRQGRLTVEELETVRDHARIGSVVVRAAHDARTARIIARQYQDYADARRQLADSRTLLLAGILRVADVFDAVTTPRPYQRPLSPRERQVVLQQGSGAKFHPAAVMGLMQWLASQGQASRA